MCACSAKLCSPAIVVLFPAEPDTHKTPLGEESYNPQGLVQRTIRALKAKHPELLVCTDVGSGGLDIEAVEHVVLFDCPKNPVDFLHRVGRTARAGAAGRATCLYHKSQDGEVVRALKEAYRRKLPVRGLVGGDHSHREGQGEEARARA